MAFNIYNNYYGYVIGINSSGSIGKNFVYYVKNNVQYRRSWILPPDPKSQGQLRLRDLMRKAVLGWHSLTNEAKTQYVDTRRGDHPISGYNFYISEYIKSYL